MRANTLRKPYLLFLALYTLLALAVARADGFDPSLLRNGDLVFQTSRSGQSQPIQLATRSPWSHCGVVYIQRGKVFVYEASTEVKLTPWKRFIRKGEGGRFEVKRLRDADSVLTAENLRRLALIDGPPGREAPRLPIFPCFGAEGPLEGPWPSTSPGSTPAAATRGRPPWSAASASTRRA